MSPDWSYIDPTPLAADVAELYRKAERLELAIRRVLSWKLSKDVRKELEAALRNGKP